LVQPFTIPSDIPMRTGSWQAATTAAARAGMKQPGEQLSRLFQQRGVELYVPGNIQLVEEHADGELVRLLARCGTGGVDRWRTDTAGLLDEFGALAEASDDAILRFAQRWGLLSLCEHELPDTHNPGRYGCRPSERESLAVWRHFSRAAGAIVSIAAALHQGEDPRPQDWAAVYERSGQDAPWWDSGADFDAHPLSLVVNEWLVLGDVRPALRWRAGSDPEIFLQPGSGTSLFGAIARELAFVVSRVDGLAVCSGCGAGFVPKRRPAAGRRSWCPACKGAGKDRLKAKQEYRRRKRSA